MVEKKMDAIEKRKEKEAIEAYRGQEAFMREHGRQLLTAYNDYKDLEELYDLLQGLDNDLPQKEHLMTLLQKLNPDRKGFVGDSPTNFFVDLKLFHGTGDDPNRPADQLPGDLYLSSSENLGKEFVGTPLFIWTGRELIDRAEPGEMGKRLCLSQDRKVGDAYGYCQECRYLPWRKGVENDIYCRNFVNALMLMQDGREVVLVRFAKTSEAAGRQLMAFASRTPSIWSRWYSLKTKVRTNEEKGKKLRWFVYTVEMVAGDEGKVPKELHPVCDALYCAAAKEYVFPQIARTYVDLGGGGTGTGASDATPEVLTEATDAGLDYSGINEDA